MEQLAITIGIKGLLFIVGVCVSLCVVAALGKMNGEGE